MDTITIGTTVKCECGETLTPSGHCLNVGKCEDADTHASRASRGTAIKARQVTAWTIRGGVD